MNWTRALRALLVWRAKLRGEWRCSRCGRVYRSNRRLCDHTPNGKVLYREQIIKKRP